MITNFKILIVRLSAIGDVAHSLPILSAIKKSFPGVHIGWAVEDRASDIIVNNPLVDKAYVFPKSKWKKRGFSLENIKEFVSVMSEIKKEKYDIAIDLQELLKSGIVTFLSGAKRRIAHKGTREFAELFVNEKLPVHDIFDPNKLIIERYLEPAKYLGANTDNVEFSLPPVSEETKTKIDELLAGSDKTKELVVFCPATIWPSKHWREDYWAELLDKLSDKYKVAFIGTNGDKELIKRITSQAKTEEFINLAGKTTILELIELFNRTKYLVAPDTGPAHIANATQVPTILMFFGSTGVKRTPPYGEKHSAFAAILPCQPCFKRNCPRKDGFMECINQVTPDMILEKID